MRSALCLLSLVWFAAGCRGAADAPADAPAAEPPVQVLDGLQPEGEGTPELDADTAAKLQLLAGDVGELAFPSTRDAIAACRAGDADRCVSVGTRLMHGTWGLERDAAAALPLFEFGCEAGVLEGCYSLAVALRFGRGADADLPRSVELFQRACDGEHVVACSFLAEAHHHGRGVEPDPARALAIYERACLLGGFCRDVPRQRLVVLGAADDAPFSTPGETPDAACASGDPRGCWWQAMALSAGEDSDATYARIRDLHAAACDGQLADACVSLGFHRLRQRSSPGAVDDAARAFEAACALGVGCEHAAAIAGAAPGRADALADRVRELDDECRGARLESCLLLGIAYQTGNGVARDRAHATELFTRVCDGGGADGCWYLGCAYRAGRGVAQDLDRAAALFRAACEADHANGCVDLAFAHVHGRGVPADLARAVALFDRACGLGTACEHAEHYREELSP